MQLSVRLHQRFQPIHAAYAACQSNARFLCVVAGRRGGKTKHGTEIFVERVYRDLERLGDKPYFPGAARRGTTQWRERRPRLHYWVVAEVTDLLDELKRGLLEAIPAELIEHMDSAGAGKWWLAPDILVEFKSGKDPKRLVSSGLNGLWIEEASRLRPDAWVGNLRPTISDKQGWCLVTGTPLGRDWVYDEFVVKAQQGVPGYEFHTWRTVDNTSCPGLRDEVALAKRTLPEEYFRREYEASFEAFIGQIYHRFSEKKHVFQGLPKGVVFRAIGAGVDWGVSNPGAIIVIGIDTREHVWVLDEIYAKNELVEDFWLTEARKMASKYHVTSWVGDPAEPDNIRRFRTAGLPMVGHRNYGSGEFDEHNRSILAGIRQMASLFHQDRLHISSRCKNVIEELKSYVWDTDARKQQLDRPAPHQKDHAITALRYVVSHELRDAGFKAAA